MTSSLGIHHLGKVLKRVLGKTPKLGCVSYWLRAHPSSARGGFAINAAGLPQVTGDIDCMVAVDGENEGKVFRS